MSKLTYTMTIEKEDGSVEIVARRVTAGDALGIAAEYGGAGQAMVAHWEAGHSRCFQFVRLTPAGAYERLLTATVPRSSDFATDAAKAKSAFETMFLNDAQVVWAGRIVLDRVRGGPTDRSRAARRRERIR